MMNGTRYIVEMRAQTKLADGSTHDGDWNMIPEKASTTLEGAKGRLADWREEATSPKSEIADEMAKLGKQFAGTNTVLQARILKITVQTEEAAPIEEIDPWAEQRKVPVFIIQYRLHGKGIDTSEWETVPIPAYQDLYKAIKALEDFSARAKDPKGTLPAELGETLNNLQGLMEKFGAKAEMRIVKRSISESGATIEEVVEEATAAW